LNNFIKNPLHSKAHQIFIRGRGLYANGFIFRIQTTTRKDGFIVRAGFW